MMKNLFVIGNGFDLHHGFKTSYKNFYDYLKGDESLFKRTCDLFWGQNRREDQLWSDFEMAISGFNIDTFIPEYKQYNESILVFENSDNIEKEVAKWKDALDQAFRQWIKNATATQLGQFRHIAKFTHPVASTKALLDKDSEYLRRRKK